MKVLITGAAGMLGSDLALELSKTCSVTGLSREAPPVTSIEHFRCDITDSGRVGEIVSRLRPDVIVHAAGYTDVDGCERNSEKAFLVNTQGTKAAAAAALAAGSGFVFFSSDYVFDGLKKEPYTEDDSPSPASVYGRSKFEAETYLRGRMQKVVVARVEWLFGEKGRNFFKSILKKIESGEPLRVVDDQLGAPTYTKDLAVWIGKMIEKSQGLKSVSGCEIYHLANAGITTWHAAAKELIEIMGLDVRVETVSSSELGRAAQRPSNSVFNLAKINRDFRIEPRPWQEALRDYWRHSLKKEWEEFRKTSPNCE